MNVRYVFFCEEGEERASLVFSPSRQVFSVFFFLLFVCMPKNREKRKRGRRFFDHETTETFDDGTLSIHTDTRHQHHHHGFYYCFKYRSRRGIICESSFSLVFDSSSFFSLSLSLRARMRAVLASRLFTPLFYPFLKKCIITHRRNNNNHNNSEPKLSLARPHRRRALSP